MGFNLTQTWVESRQSIVLLAFSEKVTTVSAPLKGPGGSTINGYPVPMKGRVTGLYVYDGTSVQQTSEVLDLSAGDIVSLSAVFAGGTFRVNLIVNGTTTSLGVSNNLANTDLLASLVMKLVED